MLLHRCIILHAREKVFFIFSFYASVAERVEALALLGIPQRASRRSRDRSRVAGGAKYGEFSSGRNPTGSHQKSDDHDSIMSTVERQAQALADISNWPIRVKQTGRNN